MQKLSVLTKSSDLGLVHELVYPFLTRKKNMDLNILRVIGYHNHPKPLYLENIFLPGITQKEKIMLCILQEGR